MVEKQHPQWRSGLRKLTDEDVAEIRRRWDERPTSKTLATEYGVAPRYIQSIIQNRKRKRKV